MKSCADTGYVCNRDALCTIYNMAVKVAEPRRGVRPAFEVKHVIALILVALNEPIGRPSISRILGLGDTATKTLVRRAREEGLIVGVGRRGVLTVKEVASLIEALRPCMTEHCVSFYVGCEPWCESVSRLEPLLRLRDELVKLGLNIRLIACCSRGVRVPGADESIVKEVYWACKECIESASTCVIFSGTVSVLELSGVIEAAARIVCS